MIPYLHTFFKNRFQFRWGVPLAIVFLTAATLFTFLTTVQTSTAIAWQSKVDPTVLRQIDQTDHLEFIVELEEQADLSALISTWNRSQKGAYVVGQLQQVARETQAPLLQDLAAAGVSYKPFWVTNAVWVSGPSTLIAELAQRTDIRFVHPNLPIPQTNPIPPVAADGQEILANEWGIDKINAPLLWSEGITGSGAIIGGQDTGYQWDHPALIDSYQGWNTATQSADHNYAWHDAITTDLNGNSTNILCGFGSTIPCDDHGHGTHTMGTMSGTVGGTGRQIGVAPGAKWVGCRSMEEGWGTPSTYINCFQWFMAPTDLNDQNPDPTRAPHVINNSWGCPPSEGCNSGNFAVMEQVVDNLRAAGIAVVVSAGNSGSGGCGTVSNPAAIYDSAITIGATGQSDQIASFSSRGPVTVDGSNRLKPDLTAPGLAVYSAYRGSGYATLQGTSMAGPHVASAIALLISAVPEAAGHVDLLELALKETAVPLTTTQGCGGDTSTSVPNNVYGAGRIDVAAARSWLQTQFLVTVELPPTHYDISPTTPLSTPLSLTVHITRQHGITAAQPLTVQVDIPSNTTFFTATAPFSQIGQTVSWSLADFAIGQSATFSLTVKLADPTPAPTYTVTFANIMLQTPGAPSLNDSAATTIWHTPRRLYLPILIK